MGGTAWRETLFRLALEEPDLEDYTGLTKRVTTHVALLFQPEEIVLRKPDMSLYGRDVHQKLLKEDKTQPKSYEDYLIREARHILPRVIEEKHMTRWLFPLLDPDGVMMYLELAWCLAAGTKRFHRDEMVRFNRALAEYFIRRALRLRTLERQRIVQEALEHLPLGVAVVASDRRIHYANPALLTYVKADRAAVVDRPCNEAIGCRNEPPPDCPLVQDGIQTCSYLKTRDGQPARFFRVSTKHNGKAVLVLPAYQPARHGDPRHARLGAGADPVNTENRSRHEIN
ncbi:PAS fold-containing protein [Desulfacinum hydrothermale DSM 13146]|uniref:PAS fold-containing protein n=1 Tax=Desulfacinum hydrothermale DSM 13146 TaxID=1121390 RepID=A0A1W1XS83_9BACT|nr:PAS domain-containing protein [Desulfacinum hydrothermale]SMC26756.1 PAS fold-containing protein [Desulfacinum hydrothermale DSM 13146]